jgi:hypothetical protein
LKLLGLLAIPAEHSWITSGQVAAKLGTFVPASYDSCFRIPDSANRESRQSDCASRIARTSRGLCPVTEAVSGSVHRPTSHGDHSDPEGRSSLESGLPGRSGPKRNPARHPDLGRVFQKRLTGYPARIRIEAKMRRLNAMEGRIAARDSESETAEIQMGVAVINRLPDLGTAGIVCMG